MSLLYQKTLWVQSPGHLVTCGPQSTQTLGQILSASCYYACSRRPNGDRPISEAHTEAGPEGGALLGQLWHPDMQGNWDSQTWGGPGKYSLIANLLVHTYVVPPPPSCPEQSSCPRSLELTNRKEEHGVQQGCVLYKLLVFAQQV